MPRRSRRRWVERLHSTVDGRLQLCGVEPYRRHNARIDTALMEIPEIACGGEQVFT